MPDLRSGRDASGILARTNGASIAYRRIPCLPGHTPMPTVVFLHGLMSDMHGGKAEALAEHAERRGFGFLRFDMFGHGESSGAFTEGTIGRWRDDALAAIDELTEGPVVLVGSSMGGWVMLLAAIARPQRVKALLGIAAAPDFTETEMWAQMPQNLRDALVRDGIVHLEDTDGSVFPVSRGLIADGRDNLLLQAPIPFAGPVRLLQGMRDASVPWKTALAIADRLTGEDVRVALVKDGDHRLSRPQDLDLLTRTLDALLAAVAAA